jgi:type IV pilus assembly protein PilC
MPKFSYVAMDQKGKESKGTLDAATQNEAIGRVKEMNLFPTKIVELDKEKPEKKGKAAAVSGKSAAKKKAGGMNMNLNIKIPFLSGRVKSKVLTTFTRQLATLVDAGLPLLRGMRVLEKQERNKTLKEIIAKLSISVEGGSTFSEGLAQHPKVFNKLYVNMVKAGELGGVLEVVLNRLAQFQEKAQKIKGKVIAAMFYPIAVIVVAVAIVGVLMVFVIPKFQEVFNGLLDGAQMPAFTLLVLGISTAIKDHIVVTLALTVLAVILFLAAIRTKVGRHVWDKFKLKMPALGPVISKIAIGRFARTLGTLVSSGVPILQALHIVKETAGNVIISDAITGVYDSVKQGETITAPLEASGAFPPMVISMVDVGEQTGALPEMLLKIADNYDEEVDNAVSAMTSLLEPIMIIVLGLIVGSIVIAMFLPLVALINGVGDTNNGKE